MKKLILCLAYTALLAACGSTPPKAPQPSGEWTPVNKPLTAKG